MDAGHAPGPRGVAVEPRDPTWSRDRSGDRMTSLVYTVAKRSAGILLFRSRDAGLEVLLVHPGGPFWAKKDLGAWSIPKGEHDEGEDGLACALREFREETETELNA